ncbi:MAG TPA: amino acid adenylation protein, partial [Acidobacteria bacterium]|nr:amino acid adenylation protein [Acidobacteriota bacterium]
APGDRVALDLDRSPAQVVAILAVLKTGAAYVPLDPTGPPERRSFQRADSGVTRVLDADFFAREGAAIARQSGERLRLPLDPGLPAYVIYT